MVNEVLELAKIESGRLVLTIEPTPVSAIIVSCMSMANFFGVKYGITITNNVALPETVAVMADLTRGKQILLNLVSNAIKYNRPDGKVVLDCSAAESGMVRFTVQDTGPGIDEEFFDELFLPFNRLGNESEEIEGTGIGLSITKELVEYMGGKIGVESTLGEGSKFWFELPPAKKSGVIPKPNVANVPIEISIATTTANLPTTNTIL